MTNQKKIKLEPKKTIIAVDLHGVLFTHNYKKMFKTFWQHKKKLKLLRAIISPALWLDFFKLLKKNAVAEEYIVGLANKHHRLKPFVPLGIKIANTQQPSEPVIAMLKTLKKNGCSLHLFSNIGDTIFADLLNKFPKTFTLFEGFTISAPKNNYQRKPQAQAFQDFLKKHNQNNKTVILIDDKRKNIRGARQNGLIGIFFESAQQIEKRLQELELLQ